MNEELQKQLDAAKAAHAKTNKTYKAARRAVVKATLARDKAKEAASGTANVLAALKQAIAKLVPSPPDLKVVEGEGELEAEAEE